MSDADQPDLKAKTEAFAVGLGAMRRGELDRILLEVNGEGIIIVRTDDIGAQIVTTCPIFTLDEFMALRGADIEATTVAIAQACALKTLGPNPSGSGD